jgi:hypothetical protein
MGLAGGLIDGGVVVVVVVVVVFYLVKVGLGYNHPEELEVPRNGNGGMQCTSICFCTSIASSRLEDVMGYDIYTSQLQEFEGSEARTLNTRRGGSFVLLYCTYGGKFNLDFCFCFAASASLPLPRLWSCIDFVLCS